MKSAKSIQNMYDNVLKAKRELWNAVSKNLVELGREFEIVGDGDNEEHGYPEGMLMRIPNKHDIEVDCVYDRVKVENGKVLFHQAYWDDGEDDYWQHSEDIGMNDLIELCGSIDWDDALNGVEDDADMYAVTYVGLSDSEYNANGYCECKVCKTKEDAKRTLKEWRENEIECLKSEGREYEILEDEDDECRISWCGHGEQLRLEIHEVTIP